MFLSKPTLKLLESAANFTYISLAYVYHKRTAQEKLYLAVRQFANNFHPGAVENDLCTKKLNSWVFNLEKIRIQS